MFLRALLRHAPPLNRFRPLAGPIVAIGGGMTIAGLLGSSVHAEVIDDAREIQSLLYGRAIKSDKVLEIRHHAEAAVPGGAMGRSRFIRAFNDLGVDDDRTVDHFFDCHDKDENGRVPFENFLASVAIVGKPMSQAHSKLNFIIECCKQDAGHIETEEFKRIVRALMETHEKFVIREIPPPAVPWSGKYFWDKLSWKVAASTEDKTGRKPGEPAWTGKSQVARLLREYHGEKLPEEANRPTFHQSVESVAEALTDRIRKQIIHDSKTASLPLNKVKNLMCTDASDAQFLRSLCEGTHIDHFTGTHHYHMTMDNVTMPDGSTLL